MGIKLLSMELKNHKAVAYFLSEAAAQQWNRVAFDPGKDQPVFHGYVFAGEASELCSASNNVFDDVLQDSQAGSGWLPGKALRYRPAHDSW